MNDTVKALLINDDMDGLKKYLSETIDHNSNEFEQLLNLSGQLKDIETRNRLNAISYDEYSKVKSKIRIAFIELSKIKMPEKSVASKQLITNVLKRVVYQKSLSFFNTEGLYEEQLKSLITKADRSHYINIIIGSGGSGKTYLASKTSVGYAKSADTFDVIWFIDSETQESMFSDLKQLSKKLNIHSPDTLELLSETLKDFLNNTEKSWLLIFDNACDHQDTLKFENTFFPITAANKQIIITSRNRGWVLKRDYIREHIAINSWSKKDIKNYFTTAKDLKISARQIDKFYSFTGGLPLIITQIGSYLTNTGMEADDYIKIYEQKDNYQKMLMAENEDYKFKSIYNTSNISFSKLPEQAKYLLSFYSFLGPDNIPVKKIIDKLFRLKEEAKNINFFQHFDDEISFYQGNKFILKYSLGVWKEGVIAIHRLVKSSIQVLIEQELSEYENSLSDVIKILNVVFDFKDKITEENAEYFELLAPHIQFIISRFDKLPQNLCRKEKAELAYKYGFYKSRLRNKVEAIKILEESLKIVQSFKDEPLEHLITMRLGKVLYTTYNNDNISKGKPLIEKSLAFFETQNNLKEQGRCLDYLGLIAWRKKKYKEALSFYKKALKTTKVNEDSVLHDIGLVYRDLMEYPKAFSYFNKAYEKAKNNYTKAITNQSLGILYINHKEFRLGLKHLQESYDFFYELKEKRWLSYVLYYFATYYLDIGDYALAKKYIDKHRACAISLTDDLRFQLQSHILDFRGGKQNLYEGISINDLPQQVIKSIFKFPIHELQTISFVNDLEKDTFQSIAKGINKKIIEEFHSKSQDMEYHIEVKSFV